MAGGSDPTVTQASDVRAPSGASAPTGVQRIAGTGSTADTNGTALTGGELATLIVGGVAVVVDFGGADPVDPAAATALRFAANTRFDWVVTVGIDDFVGLEADDGASAFEGWVWTSSGPRSAT